MTLKRAVGDFGNGFALPFCRNNERAFSLIKSACGNAVTAVSLIIYKIFLTVIVTEPADESDRDNYHRRKHDRAYFYDTAALFRCFNMLRLPVADFNIVI